MSGPLEVAIRGDMAAAPPPTTAGVGLPCSVPLTSLVPRPSGGKAWYALFTHAR